MHHNSSRHLSFWQVGWAVLAVLMSLLPADSTRLSAVSRHFTSSIDVLLETYSMNLINNTASLQSEPITDLLITPTPNSEADQACAITFKAEPDQAQAGQPIVLTGMGFEAEEPVQIGLMLPMATDTPSKELITLPTQQTDASGMLAFVYRTEAMDPLGLYMVAAEGLNTGCKAEATFLLETPAASPTEETNDTQLTPTPTATTQPTETATPTPVILLMNVDPLLRNIPINPWQPENATVTPTPTTLPSPTATPVPVLPGKGGRR